MLKIVAPVLLIFAIALAGLAGCSSCNRGEDEPAKASSGTFALKIDQPAKQMQDMLAKPRIRIINIGPSKEVAEGDQPSASTSTPGDKSLPKDVNIDNALTSRLKEKLNQAFADKGGVPPEIEIYTGSMSLDSFAKYYEDKGFKVQRTSVPASSVISPLLEEKPELVTKINMSNYQGVDINQVIVEGANISAADKYIDPETYSVVYKTFVTMTKMK